MQSKHSLELSALLKRPLGHESQAVAEVADWNLPARARRDAQMHTRKKTQRKRNTGKQTQERGRGRVSRKPASSHTAPWRGMAQRTTNAMRCDAMRCEMMRACVARVRTCCARGAARRARILGKGARGTGQTLVLARRRVRANGARRARQRTLKCRCAVDRFKRAAGAAHRNEQRRN